jgi:intracellular multiplication protein IcmK
MKIHTLVAIAACQLSVMVVNVAHAQTSAGSVRISPGQQSVQPLPEPALQPRVDPKKAPPPAVFTPVSRSASMPTPLPGSSMQPIDLKQEALEQTAPLTPAEILDLRRELEARGKAASEPLTPIGRPVRRLLPIDLSPGAPPEVVRTTFGQGTVVSFLDAAGRPWPVAHVDNFNPAAMSVALLGVNGVSIGVKSARARIGNVAVLLEGMSAPVTFAVAIAQEEIDYSVELQMPRYLPGLPAPVGAVETLPSLGAAGLMDYLLGTVPAGIRKLSSSSQNVQAWQVSPTLMIVRTSALLASPRYSRRQSSGTGTTVYELPVTGRLVLAAEGQMQTVTVGGFEATKEAK